MSEIRMIPCDQVVIRLWEYIDGELNEHSAAEVAAHLEMCQRCFPHYNFQRSYKEFIRRTHDGGASPGVRRRIFESILAEQGREAEGGGRMGARLRSAWRNFFGG